MYRTVILTIMMLNFVSCSIHYSRGKEYEKVEDYENANIEYQRAQFTHPTRKNYQEAYQRTTQKLLVDFKTRYEKQLRLKNLHIAYNILQRAIALDDSSPFFLKEKENWIEVLISGQVKYDFTQANLDITLSNNIEFILQLNTPNQLKILTAFIDPKTGIFKTIDYLYKPTIHLLFLYSLNTIGIGLNQQDDITNKYDNIHRLVNLRTPLLTKVRGKTKELKEKKKDVANFYPVEALSNKKSFFWNYKQPIEYAVEIKENKAIVNTISPIDFLSQIIYTNFKQKKVFLDFGVYVVKRDQFNSWGFQREFSEKRDYIESLKKNLLYQPFMKYNETALYLEKSN